MNTNDDGTDSLRACIALVNADASDNGLNPDTISFNIPNPGSVTQTIHPASALPAITRPVIIDGYTEPGGAHANSLANGDNANILIELNGSVTPGNSPGLLLPPLEEANAGWAHSPACRPTVTATPCLRRHYRE
jgi:hypothetical protein